MELSGIVLIMKIIEKKGEINKKWTIQSTQKITRSSNLNHLHPSQLAKYVVDGE